MGRIKFALATAAVVLGATGTAAAHLMDARRRAAPSPPPRHPRSSPAGRTPQWELVATIPTGNPHTDLDFFTSGGDTYASVGTLAAGAQRAAARRSSS